MDSRPDAIAVIPANVTDRAGILVACRFCKAALSKVNNVLVDGGYTGQLFADAIHDTLCATVEVVKRNGLHAFAVIPKRWGVERSFAWLEKCRGLWKNCERQFNTSLQFVNLAFLALLLRRL
jgi:transposase